MIQNFHSNGKLLITGEYLVLDGALALAVPVKYGQSLEVHPGKDGLINWTALDHQGREWFKTKLQYNGKGFKILSDKEPSEFEKRLLQIISEAYRLNPNVLADKQSFKINTKLDFPQNWGLGSSSTLINNISQWFKINPYLLLEKTFGGSGYDIAAAQTDAPFTYQLINRDSRSILASPFNPEFKDQLFFVHLNRKQNSRSSIAHYKQQSADFLEEAVLKISALTEGIINCNSIEEFKLLVEIHETLISKIIKTPKIKSSEFPDFPGAIKSLGGWGGDFILATGGEEERSYFRKKGYSTILSYSVMVK